MRSQVHQLFPGTTTTVDVTFIDASHLMELINSQAMQSLPLPLVENPIAVGTRKDFVALVKLAHYYSFITDESGALRKYIFESNVRDYQGHNSVNTEIHNTLAGDTSEDFWWLNNGVTILASDIIQSTPKQLLVTNPEIVNGLQTSNEIYQFFREHPENLELEDRNILLRIVVPGSEASRDKIILATNSQTAIPPVALRSTDPIHLQIEMYFKLRGLFYDRRKNYYKNMGKKSNEIVSIAFLGQCLMSLFLNKPNYARARPSTLLSNEEYYNKLYVENTDLEVYYRSALLGKKVERFFKSSSDYIQAEKSDILFYVIYSIACLKLRSSTIDLSQFKEIDINSISDEEISYAAKIVSAIYHELGGNNKVAKGSALLDKLQEEIARRVSDAVNL